MNNPHLIFDKNKKSLKIIKLLKKEISKSQFKDKNLVIVVGGDGFMLETLKKNRSLKKKLLLLLLVEMVLCFKHLKETRI